MSNVNIGISAEHREQISAGLGRLLADTYTPVLNHPHNFSLERDRADVQQPARHVYDPSQYTELWNAVRSDCRTHPFAGAIWHRGRTRNLRN